MAPSTILVRHMTPETIDLKQILRSSDLAFLAGKKRQSPRTGFVHLYYGNETAADTIPIYENFCYVLALLFQKKGETVLEAKKLLARLLPFQIEEGNFPIYLHDFPQCYDIYLGLKIGPILLKIRNFKAVLGEEIFEKIDRALRKLFSFYENKTLAPLWEFRRDVCRYVFDPSYPKPLARDFDFEKFSASDWWEYWISLQFLETPVCRFYHSGLQMAQGFPLLQDRFEPAPRLIDWILCKEDYQPRLLQDRAVQLQLVALDKVMSEENESSIYFEKGNVFWKEQMLHSLVSENITDGVAVLPTTFEMGRDDLFELAYYCDASASIEILINGKKGTVFSLSDVITIQSATRRFSLKFELINGEGEFCGHIFRSNRPSQIATTNELQYEAFDWKIALRTLRRSSVCSISAQLLCFNAELSTASPMACIPLST